MSQTKNGNKSVPNDGINGCSTYFDCVCKRDQFVQYIYIRAGFSVELNEKKKLKQLQTENHQKYGCIMGIVWCVCFAW